MYNDLASRQHRTALLRGASKPCRRFGRRWQSIQDPTDSTTAGPQGVKNWRFRVKSAVSQMQHAPQAPLFLAGRVSVVRKRRERHAGSQILAKRGVQPGTDGHRAV